MSELTPGETVYLMVSIADNTYPYPITHSASATSSFEISAYWDDYFLEVPVYTFDKFTSFPNPVKDFIHLSNDIEITKVEIYTMLGQKVQSHTINATKAKIDFSDFSKGMYLIHVSSGGKTKIIKVLKS